MREVVPLDHEHSPVAGHSLSRHTACSFALARTSYLVLAGANSPLGPRRGAFTQPAEGMSARPAVSAR